MRQEPIRYSLQISGQVQGVGFRPGFYRLAAEAKLTGFVRNTSRGVEAEIQGAPEAVETFCRTFQERLKALSPRAAIRRWKAREMPAVAGEEGFRILESSATLRRDALVSPDLAVCAACRADIREPGNRRHGYAFTNCVSCGPRYTILGGVPYDRHLTSMACFAMCPECAAEFGNPRDRRFHAQPNACPVCGPKMRFTDRENRLLANDAGALEALAACLNAGEIAAIKGLGGFQLACDAWNDQAVAALRRRKCRPRKAFALMVRDAAAAEAFVWLDEGERALLESPAAPIVLCRRRYPELLSPRVAPDGTALGVMLPPTPLHLLLFDALERLGGKRPPALVMTSGNRGGEPIVLGNREALEELGAIADRYLLHNRDILARADDSVVRLYGGAPEMVRRARGYAPAPVELPCAGGMLPSVLAVGAELKNTVCLTRGSQAFLSPHLGDMGSPGGQDFFDAAIRHLLRLFGGRPGAVVCDCHPGYFSSGAAKRLAAEFGATLLRLQHHAAHLYAVLAEHGRLEKTLGLILDGTGFGHDGTIWGGELLAVDPLHPLPDCRRLGSIAPLALPGGDAAAREPWRMTLAAHHAAGLEPDAAIAAWGREGPGAEKGALLWQMLEKGVNAPRATSCGRLFDAVFGLIGPPDGALAQTYEGEAPIRLEALLKDAPADSGGYACPLGEREGRLEARTHELFEQVWRDWRKGVSAAAISLRFHNGLAEGLGRLAAAGASREGVEVIALGGGVLQNICLRRRLEAILRRKGLRVLAGRDVPANDGGIALGQAFWGTLAASAHR